MYLEYLSSDDHNYYVAEFHSLTKILKTNSQILDIKQFIGFCRNIDLKTSVYKKMKLNFKDKIKKVLIKFKQFRVLYYLFRLSR